MTASCVQLLCWLARSARVFRYGDLFALGVQEYGLFWETTSGMVPLFSSPWFDNGYMHGVGISVWTFFYGPFYLAVCSVLLPEECVRGFFGRRLLSVYVMFTSVDGGLVIFTHFCVNSDADPEVDLPVEIPQVQFLSSL